MNCTDRNRDTIARGVAPGTWSGGGIMNFGAIPARSRGGCAAMGGRKSRGLIILVASVTALGCIGAFARAQVATGTKEIKSIDDVLELVPKELARDLDKKAKRDAAALDISRHLMGVALGREASLELVVDSWRPWKDFVGAAYQLRPKNQDVRCAGVRYLMDMWVYVPASSGPGLERLKRGDQFAVTGTIARADVTIDEAIRFHLTLKDAQIFPK